MKKTFLISLLFAFSSISYADIMVQVHGYLGNAMSWERSGVNAVLTQNGWQRAGILTQNQQGIVLYRDQSGQKQEHPDKKIFSVDLPSHMPILIQSDILIAMLKWIEKTWPDEKIKLVGHSAGGVVARLSLLNKEIKNVDTLITIAAPHMGTWRAAEALDFSDDIFPISLIKDFLSNGLHSTLRHSRGLLYDLLPPRPGSILALINTEKHPDIRYVSVIRTMPFGISGDTVVPGLSQDMNSVAVLNGRSERLYSHTGHELILGDGYSLLKILK